MILGTLKLAYSTVIVVSTLIALVLGAFSLLDIFGPDESLGALQRIGNLLERISGQIEEATP